MSLLASLGLALGLLWAYRAFAGSAAVVGSISSPASLASGSERVALGSVMAHGGNSHLGGSGSSSFFRANGKEDPDSDSD